ncbi:uncharacterized protein BT62DRAFT_935622 [Guyanagaster necrorhizus]|uniref:Uncharacterized protein n=1 Tax=Guyanagaster necrorhizus TaxID=856835 RepID=A0A9P8APE5_9AGAR|nr:uncharacterized protein BT62DRAFT_935622 [Guyanagaster necrorhizus MCA 3950]KAG7442894.1 hypothetical protein BT62DRAFT_935622 [Guyanagaster necrorhizus MCA 3950]
MSVTGLVSTIFADSAMIWRCWMVWGKRWPIVAPPILFLISGSVLKALAIYKRNTGQAGLLDLPLILYMAFTLATTLWCTLMIIIHILSVRKASTALERPTKLYRHIIELLVESSGLYAITLIPNIALLASQNMANYYMETMGAITRGVAPTLLIGGVGAGHAWPEDFWQGSVTSSLRFGTQSGDSGQMSSQDDATQSVVRYNDLECLPDREDNLNESVSE